MTYKRPPSEPTRKLGLYAMKLILGVPQNMEDFINMWQVLDTQPQNMGHIFVV